MKSAVTSLDCLALALEMQGFLGARFDKAFQPSKDEVILRLRLAGEGTREWRVRAGKWAYLSQGTKDYAEALTPFAQTLRTHLDGGRLAAVRQVGFDRLLELEFQKPQGTYLLACELFGEGNVILARDGKIVQPSRYLKVAHRTVAPGEAFAHPPSRLNPRTAPDEEMMTKLLGSRADAVRTVATEWNLGGPVAEEVCARAGVPKGAKAAKLEPAQREALVRAWRDLVAQVEGRPEPGVVRDGARTVDAVPVPLEVHAALSFEARGSVSMALEDHFTAWAKEHEQPEDPRVGAVRAEADRLRRQIEAQEASLAGFEQAAQEERALGDLLYARFGEVEALLGQARERKAAGGFAALQAWASEADQPAPFKVAGADGAEGTLTVEVDGKALALRLDADVHGNANARYEAAKRQREKVEGARAALGEARARLAELEQEGSALAAKVAKERARRKYEPTKRMWFEAYRWFISSEGCLVLGGRDAQSNDKLVKKHLEAQDRYVHADMPGAPSVVVKRGQLPEVGEATLQEAAAFAVAYSKAWQRRLGSADAYWVTPEQVSKTPQSGEYLAKGAFIIRGKRTFLNSPLRAAVGEVQVEGHRKVMGGPVAAVQARAARYVVLEPGQGDANALARELAEAFQVPVEEIQAVLPPGPVRVAERRGLDGDADGAGGAGSAGGAGGAAGPAPEAGGS